jgi:hypothetical protein
MDPQLLPIVLQDRQYHSRRSPNREMRTWKAMTGGPVFRLVVVPGVQPTGNWIVLLWIRSAEEYLQGDEMDLEKK